jgi:hypothetical protein
MKTNGVFLAALLLSSTCIFANFEHITSSLNKTGIPEICSALDKGVLFLEKVQSPAQGEFGEFATYRWSYPDQSNKEYVSTLFTTPFILHTLNYLEIVHEYIAEVKKPAFENMRLLAVTHILNNVETIEGHTGVWSFYGPSARFCWVGGKVL